MTFREFMLENGYELQTTFWNDFSIADRFGLSAIQDTFNRAFKEWKENYKYLTELVLVLNHKIWPVSYTHLDVYKRQVASTPVRQAETSVPGTGRA